MSIQNFVLFFADHFDGVKLTLFDDVSVFFFYEGIEFFIAFADALVMNVKVRIVKLPLLFGLTFFDQVFIVLNQFLFVILLLV